MVDYTKRPSSTPQPPPAGGGGGGVSLSKITLTKSAPSVSLAKGSGASGRMRVTLAWNARPEGGGGGGGGFLKKLTGGGAKGIDLDLGCLFELQDGRKGVVQALGNAFGDLERPPYVDAVFARDDPKPALVQIGRHALRGVRTLTGAGHRG